MTEGLDPDLYDPGAEPPQGDQLPPPTDPGNEVPAPGANGNGKGPP